MSDIWIYNTERLRILYTHLFYLDNIRLQAHRYGLFDLDPMLNSIHWYLYTMISNYRFLPNGIHLYDISPPLFPFPELYVLEIPSIVMDFARALELEFEFNIDVNIAPTGLASQTLPTPPRIQTLLSHKIKKKCIVIKKALLETPMNDVCGICLETHTKKDSVVCGCLHEFGRNCFNEWIHTKDTNLQITTCPSCRTIVKQLTSFRQRSPRKTIEEFGVEDV